jgi:hypothetical protein
VPDIRHVCFSSRCYWLEHAPPAILLALTEFPISTSPCARDSVAYCVTARLMGWTVARCAKQCKEVFHVFSIH